MIWHWVESFLDVISSVQHTFLENGNKSFSKVPLFPLPRRTLGLVSYRGSEPELPWAELSCAFGQLRALDRVRESADCPRMWMRAATQLRDSTYTGGCSGRGCFVLEGLCQSVLCLPLQLMSSARRPEGIDKTDEIGTNESNTMQTQYREASTCMTLVEANIYIRAPGAGWGAGCIHYSTILRRLVVAFLHRVEGTAREEIGFLH